MKLSKRTNVSLTKLREVFGILPKIAEYREGNNLLRIINLSIGQPHLSINPYVVKGLKELLNKKDFDKMFAYSPIKGRMEITQEIKKLANFYYKINYNDDEVMCTNGANQALFNALNISIDRGDLVFLLEGFFGQYETSITALGGKIKIINTDKNFRPSIKNIEQAFRNSKVVPKVIMLNYPNNPTGTILTKKEMEDIASILRLSPNTIIILDEVYRDLSDNFLSLIDVAPDLKSRTIIIHSGSKALIGAPDLRIGFALAPAEFIKAMTIQQLLSTAGVSYISQIALKKAIEAKLSKQSIEWETFIKKEYKNNVQLAIEEFKKTKFLPISKPEGGFFLLVDASCLINLKIPRKFLIKNINGEDFYITSLREKIGKDYLEDDFDITIFLLYITGVAFVPASGFGIKAKKGYLRVSCATKCKNIIEASRRIRELFDHLL